MHNERSDMSRYAVFAFGSTLTKNSSRKQKLSLARYLPAAIQK